jgi:hypothetical protein
MLAVGAGITGVGALADMAGQAIQQGDVDDFTIGALAMCPLRAAAGALVAYGVTPEDPKPIATISGAGMAAMSELGSKLTEVNPDTSKLKHVVLQNPRIFEEKRGELALRLGKREFQDLEKQVAELLS